MVEIISEQPKRTNWIVWFSPSFMLILIGALDLMSFRNGGGLGSSWSLILAGEGIALAVTLFPLFWLPRKIVTLADGIEVRHYARPKRWIPWEDICQLNCFHSKHVADPARVLHIRRRTGRGLTISDKMTNFEEILAYLPQRTGLVIGSSSAMERLLKRMRPRRSRPS